MLKICLYDNGVFNIKDFIWNGVIDEEFKGVFLLVLGNCVKDGFEVEWWWGFDCFVIEFMFIIGG